MAIDLTLPSNCYFSRGQAFSSQVRAQPNLVYKIHSQPTQTLRRTRPCLLSTKKYQSSLSARRRSSECRLKLTSWSRSMTNRKTRPSPATCLWWHKGKRMLRWRTMSYQQGLILLLRLNGSRKCKAIVFWCKTTTSSRASQWARKLKTSFWAGLSFRMRLRRRLSRPHSATSKTLRGSSSVLSSQRTRVTPTQAALAKFRTTSWITSPKSQTLQWMRWTRR